MNKKTFTTTPESNKRTTTTTTNRIMLFNVSASSFKIFIFLTVNFTVMMTLFNRPKMDYYVYQTSNNIIIPTFYQQQKEKQSDKSINDDDDEFYDSSRITEENSELMDDETNLFTQNVWTRRDLIKILDSPVCAASIQRAKDRRPRSVPMCPLCTRGKWTGTSYPIQYMKIPKAGSSTMVRLLTKRSQAYTKQAKMLCKYQPQYDEYRFTMVRNPMDRVFSAYQEVDSGHKPWITSHNISYRKYSPTNPTQSASRFLHFIQEYYNNQMVDWDAGMPHHMLSAALHLDAVRMNPYTGEYDDNLLPNKVGRLEELDLFMQELRIAVQTLLSKRNKKYGWKQRTVPSKKSLKSERVRLTSTNLVLGMEWIIQTLFEEDFVCFGYPMIDTSELYGNMSSSSFDDENWEQEDKEQLALHNHYLSKEQFPNTLLQKYQNNYLLTNITTPPCEVHYYDSYGHHVDPNQTNQPPPKKSTSSFALTITKRATPYTSTRTMIKKKKKKITKKKLTK